MLPTMPALRPLSLSFQYATPRLSLHFLAHRATSSIHKTPTKLSTLLILFFCALSAQARSFHPSQHSLSLTKNHTETGSKAIPLQKNDENNPDFAIPLWDSKTIVQHCELFLTQHKQKYNQLATLAIDHLSAQTVIYPWNALQAEEEDLSGVIGLIENVSPIPATREAAEQCELKLSANTLDILQNTTLYERLKATSAVDPIDLRWKTHMLRQFEEAGAHLDNDKRAELKKISHELDELVQAFERSIREHTLSLNFSEQELAGIPPSLLKTLPKTNDGHFKLGLSYPEYESVMGYAESETVRQKVYLAFTQRGGSKNLERLNRIVQLRQKLATLLGVHHYAEWALADRMAKTPDAVHHFLDQVADKIEPIETKDREQLRQIKVEYLQYPDVNLNRWDILFYENKLKKQRFSLDQEELRRYFSSEASVKWMFYLAKQLYHIQLEPLNAIPTWDPNVRAFSAIDLSTHERLGTLYLDLYPRSGKYNHAAAFGVRSRSTLLNRHPITALVTNLNQQGLTHNELETLLHEFGHALHGLLSDTRYVLHSGTHVERDFVEAPSQMFEEWTRQSETLSLFPRFCTPSCPALSTDQLEKLKTMRKLDKGITYARQLLYAKYDMALAEGLPDSTNAFEFWKQLERETPWGYVEGSEFPGTFGHIVSGYAAGYYGYMWSEVIALDMTTPFRHHWLDYAVGQRYKKLILSQGGQRPAEELVKEFLGRTPSPTLFFEEITGTR
jgi:thimet oligopeptidase